VYPFWGDYQTGILKPGYHLHDSLLKLRGYQVSIVIIFCNFQHISAFFVRFKRSSLIANGCNSTDLIEQTSCQIQSACFF
jgi:hypothetical protein